MAGRAQCFARTRAQRGRPLSLRRGPLSRPTLGRLIMAGRAQCFARTRAQRGLGAEPPSGNQGEKPAAEAAGRRWKAGAAFFAGRSAAKNAPGNEKPA
jgi:hypothetical protein